MTQAEHSRDCGITFANGEGPGAGKDAAHGTTAVLDHTKHSRDGGITFSSVEIAPQMKGTAPPGIGLAPGPVEHDRDAGVILGNGAAPLKVDPPKANIA